MYKKISHILSEWRRIQPFLFLTIVLSITSCDEKSNGTYDNRYGNIGDENAPTWDEIMTDSIAEEKNVSEECAAVCNDLDAATYELENVKSPAALMSPKKRYIKAVAALDEQINSYNSKEKSTVAEYKKKADKAYAEACLQFEVPASSVIANLNELLKDIDKVKNIQDMYRYEEGRLGTLRYLDDIHLCVEHDSKSIPEVKRLAFRLKNKYDSKKHEIGMK
ncbi:MAG: hypothetical protein GXY64_10205 [Bacteroidales bacterium]|nr:hypothetical protein [Bacteroidales bacterium]